MAKKIIFRGDLYQGVEWTIRPLEKNHPLRKQLEESLSQRIRDKITIARSTQRADHNRYEAVELLLNGLTHKQGMRNSFAAWFAREGRAIGIRRCYQIGKSICDELGLTIDEVRGYYNNTQWEKDPR
ncbi:MAG: hypothetical protein UU77_C0001G0023 [candidate division WWE3 bacterium GW2011_GWC1_41_7]|uniref:Uncharacterized protein n=2 Tax=Katanobacteria TaxID=422282 RepID=A0A0G1A883_UNCKA|nr:MAG: hypothetical protein UU72_C0003G0024 [candidate division WWE3 bacterium GW2011_GWB1_41_6]KKS21528.1 MAG: hypothetical protein UU77_C0001G0023 [candidate division WWE3 bacterium GW2011_GWC1_41_7]